MNLFSQTPMLEVLNGSTLSLTSDEQTRLDSLVQNNFAQTIWHIKLNPIQNYFTGSHLSIKLPDISTPIEFTPDYVSDFGTSYYWNGFNGDGSTCELIKVDSSYTSSIYVASTDSYYGIVSLSSSKNVLLKYDATRIGVGKPCTQEAEDDEVEEEEVEDRNGCEDNLIRVLFLVTPKANSSGFNPMTVANGVIAQLNSSCLASGLPATDVHFSLAGTGVAVLPGFVENKFDIKGDVTKLTNNATAQNLRALNAADVVVLLTSGSYTDAVGISKAISASKAHAFCIAEIFASTGGMTATHEVGHILGARHQRCSTCNSGLFSGCDVLTNHHGFPVGTSFRTIMFQNGCSSFRSRIARWSNPDANFGGSQTGNSFNNNAKKIRNYADNVSCFAPPPVSPPPPPPGPNGSFAVSIIGPFTIANCTGNYQYTSYVSPYGAALPIASYEWAISATGIGSWTSVGFSSSFIITNPQLLPSPTFFLRLTVVDAAGKTGIAQQQIVKTDCVGEGGGDRSRLISQQSDASFFYPNPASDFLIFGAACDGQSLTIMDINNRLIKRVQKLRNKEKISLEGVSSGIYFIVLSDNLNFQTFKFVKL